MNKSNPIASNPIKIMLNDYPSFYSKKAEHLAIEAAKASTGLSNNIEVDNLQTTALMLLEKVVGQQNLINVLTANTALPICRVNASGDIKESNLNTASLFSIDTEALISTSIVDYISLNQRDKFNVWFRQLFITSASNTIDTFIIPAKGDLIAVKINALITDVNSVSYASLFFIVSDLTKTSIQNEGEAKYKMLIDLSAFQTLKSLRYSLTQLSQ